MNQEAPYKWCSCGRGKIYTAERDSKRNAIVDGKRVCVECKVDSIYAKFKESSK